jgi:hypothetical protein
MWRAAAIIILLWAGSAGAADWYPRANERCSEYSANVFANSQGTQGAPAVDAAVAKYIADFNAMNGPQDANGNGLALMALLEYCDGHPGETIGHITAHEVETLIKAKSPGFSASEHAPVSPNGVDAYPADAPAPLLKCLRDAAATVMQQCNGKGCAPERQAFAISWAQKAYCGYSTAWNQSLRVPPEPMLRCLQDAASQSFAACKQAGCSDEGMYFTVGAAQKARCNYTALQPGIVLPASMPKGSPSNCTSSRDENGQWTTSCETTTVHY